MSIFFNKDVYCAIEPPHSVSSFLAPIDASMGAGTGDFNMPQFPEMFDYITQAIPSINAGIHEFITEVSTAFDQVEENMVDSIDSSLGNLDTAGLSVKMNSFNPTTHNITKKVTNPFLNNLNMGRQPFKRFPVMPAVTKGVISGAENGVPGSGPVNLLYHLSDQQPNQDHIDAFENMISQVQSAIQTGSWSEVTSAMNDWVSSINARLEEDPGPEDGFSENNDTFSWIALNITCGEIAAGTDVLLSPDQYNNLWVVVAGCDC